ncbi:MAG: hypothetical protein PHH54_04090 [Candidatus Nanoarchaeia archaeon]|nr:hypothetical protein [Candidatus Nanoarchaeia archaeon]MDD5741140.1 hypothetical protein [Candidatus Nanoarchaeia archaeon]
MVEPILISPFFTSYVLPFVLVFTLIFALLQKTQLLGEGKKQINAIIGLIIGLILIAFPTARDIVVQLMPFLAVSAVILFVFMLIYGFIMGKKEDVLHKGTKIALGIIFALAFITVLLYVSGWWDPIYNFMFNRETGSQIWINLLLIVIIGGAIAAVVATKDKA